MGIIIELEVVGVNIEDEDKSLQTCLVTSSFLSTYEANFDVQ